MSVTPAHLESASWGRRVAALAIDWLASWLVAVAIVGSGASEWVPLLVFWVQSSLGVALVGGSFGQMVLRLRVLRTGGHPLNLFSALLRQLMVCLVIPPLVFKPDGRGLHDLATDSGAYNLPRS